MVEKVQKKPELQNLFHHKIRNDNVLLLSIDFDESDSVMSARQYEDKPEWGLIIAAGDSALDLEEGDVVLFMSYGGTKVKALGQDFVYVRSEDIISKHVK
jgi:co-chaperonin GroES (HSP10)